MQRDDGSSNGFELRPIRQITGSAHFTETFITEARAPLFNVIGGLHNGWRVTMTTLGNERGGNATTQHVQYTEAVLGRSSRRCSKRGKRRRPARPPAAGVGVHPRRDHALPRPAHAVARSWPRRSRGPAASINKMFWSEYAQRFAESVMNIRGADAMVLGPSEPSEYAPDQWQRDFLRAARATIWGGTAQVQRNIVGERVLGLPKEPDVDRAMA